LLTSVKSNKDQTAIFLNECRQIDIAVLVPDVNESEQDFTVRIGADDSRAIRYGLSAVRNVGEGVVALISAAREAGGPFVDFHDFCERVDPTALNKRTVESLAKAGAFDSLGHARKGLVDVHEQIIDRTLARRRERDAGIMNLFADAGADAAALGFDHALDIPDTEYPKSQRLGFEKEMLGLYVSEHPLLGAQGRLKRHIECSLSEFKELRDGEMRMIGGIVTTLSRKYTRKGDLMATFVLEDLGSALEVMVFPRTMTNFGHLLEDDAIICVKGRLDMREEQPKIIAMEITRPEITLDYETEPVRLRTRVSSFTDERVQKLKDILVEHPGDSAAFVHLEGAQRTTVMRLADEYRVEPSAGLFAELRVLFGPDCLL
jgi:DNA polymerase-3 subunit alpha